MSYTNIKTKNQGFTIVELLIVVVVIAILAAITIVSYNGITNRANASAADSLVATWRKKVELYQAEKSQYPLTSANLNASAESYHITSDSLKATAPDATDGKTKVRVQACATSGTTAPTTNAAVTAIRITQWDYDKTGAAGIDYAVIGSTSIANNVDAGCVNL